MKEKDLVCKKIGKDFPVGPRKEIAGPSKTFV